MIVERMQITKVIDIMHDMFREYPLTELVFETPFQCLTSVLLSAQTTDKQVNVVTKKMYTIVRSPQDIIDLGFDQLGEMIRTVGLRKSKQKHLFRTAELLVEMSQTNQGEPLASFEWTPGESFFSGSDDVYRKYGYFLPDTLEGLTQLPGVGIKTAKVLLPVLFGKPYIAADTHVHRVMNRLGVVHTKLPNKSSQLLEEIIPPSHKWKAHRSIIYFGRYHCKARKPNCDQCPLSSICQWRNSMKK